MLTRNQEARESYGRPYGAPYGPSYGVSSTQPYEIGGSEGSGVEQKGSGRQREAVAALGLGFGQNFRHD